MWQMWQKVGGAQKPESLGVWKVGGSSSRSLRLWSSFYSVRSCETLTTFHRHLKFHFSTQPFPAPLIRSLFTYLLTYLLTLLIVGKFCQIFLKEKPNDFCCFRCVIKQWALIVINDLLRRPYSTLALPSKGFCIKISCFFYQILFVT